MTDLMLQIWKICFNSTECYVAGCKFIVIIKRIDIIVYVIKYDFF